MSDKIVLVTDYTWPSTAPEAEVLAQVGARLLHAESGSEEELLRLAPQADAILTCFNLLSAQVIRAAERLQVISRYGIGLDNIAVEEATRLGIPVTNVPAYCLDEVAEHALALLLACARKIVPYDRALQAGDWSLQTGMPVYRLAGRTLALIGFGKIGRTLARKAAALNLRLLAHDPWVPAAEIRAAGVEPVSLDEALARADFLSLHTPLTEDTQHLLNAERLRRMKSTAFVINTARGALIDQPALLQALREGWVAGAALDVFRARSACRRTTPCSPSPISSPRRTPPSTPKSQSCSSRPSPRKTPPLSSPAAARATSSTRRCCPSPRWAHLI